MTDRNVRLFSILISLPAHRRTYTAEKCLLHGHKMGTGWLRHNVSEWPARSTHLQVRLPCGGKRIGKYNLPLWCLLRETEEVFPWVPYQTMFPFWWSWSFLSQSCGLWHEYRRPGTRENSFSIYWQIISRALTGREMDFLWEMIKVMSISKGSCRKMRIPFPYSAAALRKWSFAGMERLSDL